MIEVAEVRYKGDLTAGALKVAESRIIAGLLLRKVDDEGWKDAIVKRNVLQARSPATATRLTKLVKGRLMTMGPDLWRLIRDPNSLGRWPFEWAVRVSPADRHDHGARALASGNLHASRCAS